MKSVDKPNLPPGRHEMRPEGIPAERVYCYGCKRYFKSWSEILRHHGLVGQPSQTSTRSVKKT